MTNEEARKKAIEILKENQEDGDAEISHKTADDTLCTLLINLGYADVIKEYNKIKKWYA